MHRCNPTVKYSLASVVLALAVAQAAAAAPAPLEVLQDLDVEKFYGKYFEVASYPQWFEDGCSNTALSFLKNTTGSQLSAAVTIECDRGWFHPRVSGVAVPIDEAVPARTRVTMYPPFGKEIREEFDIIMAAPNYAWVVIGHPSRKLLWILSRGASLPTGELQAIMQRLQQDFGYEGVAQRLRCTHQDGVDDDACESSLAHDADDAFLQAFIAGIMQAAAAAPPLLPQTGVVAGGPAGR